MNQQTIAFTVRSCCSFCPSDYSPTIYTPPQSWPIGYVANGLYSVLCCLRRRKAQSSSPSCAAKFCNFFLVKGGVRGAVVKDVMYVPIVAEQIKTRSYSKML